MAAAWSYLRGSPDSRTAVTASVLGGLAAAGAPLIASVTA